MNKEAEYDWAMHDDPIRTHYAHAREKHPYFCDWVQPGICGITNIEKIKECLAFAREQIDDGIITNSLRWDDLLECEMWEVFEALAIDDKTRAVEELYDCVAVLLRTIDVLEGRQKLGKPETNS